MNIVSRLPFDKKNDVRLTSSNLLRFYKAKPFNSNLGGDTVISSPSIDFPQIT